MEPLTSPRKLTLPRLEISWIWPLSQEIPFSGCQACEDLWDEERPEASSMSLLLARNCIFKRRFMAKQIVPLEPSLWQHENRASAAKSEIEHFYFFFFTRGKSKFVGKLNFNLKHQYLLQILSSWLVNTKHNIISILSVLIIFLRMAVRVSEYKADVKAFLW